VRLRSRFYRSAHRLSPRAARRFIATLTYLPTPRRHEPYGVHPPLTLRPNPLSISCSFPSSSLLHSLYHLPLTGRQSKRRAAGGIDTGILRHRLGLGLQSSSTKTTKKGTLNLNPSLRSTLSLAMIEMTCLNTIMPCLRVIADRASDPCRPLLCGSSTCTLQQSRGGYPRERSPAALSKVENSRGINESAMDKRDIELLLHTTV
jgi:hypothetical protein